MDVIPNPLIGHGVTQAVQGDQTAFDSTAIMSSYAGYFDTLHPQRPTLDRQKGFTLRFDLKINQEAHSSTNRAGCSILAVSSDLQAIEIGIWTNEVWVQSDNPLFEKAESVMLNTTTNVLTYRLKVYGTNYWLSVDNMEILSGPLRDYTAFDHTAAGLPLDPYETPNLIFLGDDTGSASASFDWSYCSFLAWNKAGLASFSQQGSQLSLNTSNLIDQVFYSLEQCSSLISNEWTVVTNWTATGEAELITTPLPATSPMFYRVKTLP